MQVSVTALGGGGVALGDMRINPYESRDTHYELIRTDDLGVQNTVRIAKNRPEITLERWGGEEAITIRPNIPTSRLGAAQAHRPLLSKRIEYRGDYTAFIEPRENDHEFDIDFILDTKPDTNVFTYTVEGADNFDFFYQPPLTDKEIAEGARRPENVIGSYAVYHKTKRNHRIGGTNYATGKAFHIYRPKAIDANGEEVWAVLSYSDGVLSVEVPQEFLDMAVYPVIVDPTFGYMSAGASSLFVSSGSESTSYGMKGNNLSGTVDSISAYLGYSTGNSFSPGTARFAETEPGTDWDVIDGFAPFPAVSGTGPELETYTASSESFLGSTVYVAAQLSCCNLTSGDGGGIYYDTGIDTEGFLVAATGSYQDESERNYSIYATYTASEEASTAATGTINSGSIHLKSGNLIFQ